eukprot:scaffold8836_cov89-Skeletonema_marinoi.AAC.1
MRKDGMDPCMDTNVDLTRLQYIATSSYVGVPSRDKRRRPRISLHVVRTCLSTLSASTPKIAHRSAGGCLPRRNSFALIVSKVQQCVSIIISCSLPPTKGVGYEIELCRDLAVGAIHSHPLLVWHAACRYLPREQPSSSTEGRSSCSPQ